MPRSKNKRHKPTPSSSRPAPRKRPFSPRRLVRGVLIAVAILAVPAAWFAMEAWQAREVSDLSVIGGGEPVQADERYFIVRVADARIETSGHTELEQQVMTQHRWFTAHELSDWHEALFPANLAEIAGLSDPS